MYESVPCDFLTNEEVEKRVAENQPLILNNAKLEKQTHSVEKSGSRAKSNLGELDKRILSILPLMTNQRAKPKEVFSELNANYPNEYTNKQITNKMWAMEKAGTLSKDTVGNYSVKFSKD